MTDRYQCRVSGVDLTLDYVETGNRLCEWVGLHDRVKLYQSTALSTPFQQWNFSAAYMLHFGMNIEDKERLCVEVARVLHPLPWATKRESSALGSPQSYKRALEHAGFGILSERNRKDFALAYFEDLRSRASAATDPAPLGLHTLMGDRRQDQMIASISKGVIAPVELFARRAR